MPPRIKDTKSKSKRRGNNEGSIYQRKDGRWCGAVTIGYKTDGKPMRKTIYGQSRQEVAKKITALTDDVFTNGYVTSSASPEHNFQALVSEWFDLFVAPTIASSTEETRRLMLKNHIYKAFGAMEIQHVDAVKLQRFFNGKVKSGMAADTINKMKNQLNNFFDYAVKKHYVSANPVTEVVIRKGTNNHDDNEKALRQEIRQDVFELVMENTLLKPIIITFTFTGLRPQELIALKWENVDLEAKTIAVKKAVKRTVSFDDSGNVVSHGAAIGATKTPKSVRTIVIPDIVVTVLKEWQLYCKGEKLHSEFVFPNTKTGGIRSYSGLRCLLTRFIKKHGLEDENITLYTFRHTFATMLLEQRESPKIVAQLMGHTKVSTTLDIYSHVVSTTVYEKTAQTLDGIYTEITQKKNPTGL